MAQEWFVYSFVARGRLVLAEHTTYISSNLPDIAAQWLETGLSPPHKKFTMKYDHHTFNFLVEDGYVYGVVAKESVGTQILFEFLERIKEDFKKRYGGHGKLADTAVGNSLSKTFAPIMKDHMHYVIDHAEEIDKLAKVNAQISEVQVIIRDNIDKVLERGQHIDSVSDKAKELYNSSQEYKTRATAIKRKMWYQNMKIKLVILGILVILALILWVSICHGFNCAN